MQSYTEIPSNEDLTDSRALLLNNDKTVMSNSSGTAFPTANLQVGMLCFRTDEFKLYQLQDLTPTWVEIADLTNGYVKNLYGLGTVKTFDGSFDTMLLNGFYQTYDPNQTNAPEATDIYFLLVTGDGGSCCNQLAIGINSGKCYRRQKLNGTWYSWKQLAFTDSNITGNAGTATKLATARNIAGVPFDGSQAIDIPYTNLTSKPNIPSEHGIAFFEGNPQILGTVYKCQVAGAHSLGATTLNIDGATPTTGTFLAGQRITIGVGTTIYTIQANATCVSGATSLTISPALDSAISDNTVVYFSCGSADLITSWTVPSGVNEVVVTIAGGGGGALGYGDGSTYITNVGGGAGEYYKKKITVTPNETIAITVGGGGNCYAVNTPQYVKYKGNSGGVSSFGTYLSANGGGGGISASVQSLAGGNNSTRGLLSVDFSRTGTGGINPLCVAPLINVYSLGEMTMGYGAGGTSDICSTYVASSVQNNINKCGKSGIVIVEW